MKELSNAMRIHCNGTDANFRPYAIQCFYVLYFFFCMLNRKYCKIRFFRVFQDLKFVFSIRFFSGARGINETHTDKFIYCTAISFSESFIAIREFQSLTMLHSQINGIWKNRSCLYVSLKCFLSHYFENTRKNHFGLVDLILINIYLYIFLYIYVYIFMVYYTCRKSSSLLWNSKLD